MAISFKGAHFPPEVILMGIRWYVAYPLSTRHVAELMEERGVEVDHSTINRWVIKYSPQLDPSPGDRLALSSRAEGGLLGCQGHSVFA
jgi:transposase-like protein